MNEERKNLEAVAAEVAKQLATSLARRDGVYIKTPLMYPSGTSVLVQILEEEGRFVVTDFGGGADEADLMGGQMVYARHAASLAKRTGVHFDDYSFFTMRVAREQLPGAVITIANCAQRAVHITALKLAERRVVEAEDRLYDRLVGVFSRPKVVRHAELVGSSATSWHVAALVVNDNDKRVAFDLVKNHPASVASSVTKFMDLARLELAPSLVAVVQKKDVMGTYINLLSAAATSVIEEGAPDHLLRRLAA
ncbi:hypothetical protein IGS68_18025 [Skermanella sp. TT6]|uniref:DUF1828 domain-containing protein n=1 Tax=Skermanella cutis TaxID=2775420 RepID=A0ABX7B3F5_9PROT|nr:hypothetical protein [Skermanella sp. TT6]QQP87962.1 hypothetical protein IGS68_18025 [Skermanella sp. TT6]